MYVSCPKERSPVYCSCRLDLRYFLNFLKFICFSHLRSLCQEQQAATELTHIHVHAHTAYCTHHCREEHTQINMDTHRLSSRALTSRHIR